MAAKPVRRWPPGLDYDSGIGQVARPGRRDRSGIAAFFIPVRGCDSCQDCAVAKADARFYRRPDAGAPGYADWSSEVAAPFVVHKCNATKNNNNSVAPGRTMEP